MDVSLRTIVLLIFGASVIYALTFVPQIVQTLNEVVSLFIRVPETVGFALASATLLLFGHVIRAYRDTILFSKAAKTRVRSQFMAFAVGSLCNSVLPLRIGEFVRADILAQRFSISFSFSFTLICLERLVDVLILGCLSLALFGLSFSLAIIGCVLFVFIVILWKPPEVLKKLIFSCGAVLNDRLEAKVLFTFWSLEYGLKRTLHVGLMTKYVLISIANWIVYVASLFPTIALLLGSDQMLRISVGIFLGLTTSAAPGALGDYTPTLEGLGFIASPELVLLWMIAIIPTALAGIILAIFNLKSLPLLRRKDRTFSGLVLENKLARNVDISSDQLGFMKDYYSGKLLARRIALKEMAGGSAFAKYFTNGGSGAMTYQSNVDGETCVIKLVSRDKSDALRAQYEWLESHASPNVVRAIGEEEDRYSYSIAIEYEDSASSFFEYVHMHSVIEGKRLLEDIVSAMDEAVWKTHEVGLMRPTDARERVQSYIDKHIYTSLDLASNALSIVGEAMCCKSLVINGEVYPNLQDMLNRIGEEDIFGDLCNFRISDSIHGDLIGDNIIYSFAKNRPIVLDPVGSRGNYFEGPVFDFGKLSQSLQIGYEFLLRDEAAVEVSIDNGVCSIGFCDNRSAIYDELWHYAYSDLAPMYLTESELRTVLFIGATNYFRRMKHQAVQCPQNAMKFYAQGIRYLDEYIRLFG